MLPLSITRSGEWSLLILGVDPFLALAPRGLENWWRIYSLKDDEVRSRLGTLLADF